MYQSISVDEFYQKTKREDVAILDVREIDEFANGHIKTAENLPLSTLTEHVGQLNSETAYYVICQMGGRSAQASEYLSSQGFQVTNVMGGMLAWKGETVNGSL